MKCGWGISVVIALLAAGCARETVTQRTGNALEQGWDFYRLGEFKLAATAFDTALETLAPDDPNRLFTLYGSATTWNLRTPIGDQDKARARALYDEILASAPDSDLAAWSMLAIARIEHLVPVGEEPDYEAVRAAYEKVVARFPDRIAGHEAFIYLQATRVQAQVPGEAKVAAEALHSFVERYPESAFFSGAQALLAACYEILEKPELQLAAEIRALETLPVDASNPKHENSARYWRIATIAEFEAGDFDTARRYYRRLLEEYPQDIRIYATEQALERMDATETELGGSG